MAAFITRLLQEPGVIAGRKEYRAAKRDVSGLNGEEFVMGGAEGLDVQEFRTSIGGEWNYPGAVSPSSLPSINLDMGAIYYSESRPSELGGFPAPGGLSEFPTEEEFFELWDGVVSSVRFRPGAMSPRPANVGPMNPAFEAKLMPVLTGGNGGTRGGSLEEFGGLKATDDWMDDL